MGPENRFVYVWLALSAVCAITMIVVMLRSMT